MSGVAVRGANRCNVSACRCRCKAHVAVTVTVISHFSHTFITVISLEGAKDEHTP